MSKKLKVVSNKKKQTLPLIKMKYKDLNKDPLERAIVKFENAEVDSITACRLHQLVRVVKPIIIEMGEKFIEEIQKPMQAKIREAMGIESDAELPTHEELGMADAEQKEKLEVLNKEHKTNLDAFGEIEVEFRLLPLAPQHLKDLKISAAEIAALGPLFDEQGELRHEHFKKRLGLVAQDAD